MIARESLSCAQARKHKQARETNALRTRADWRLKGHNAQQATHQQAWQAAGWCHKDKAQGNRGVGDLKRMEAKGNAVNDLPWLLVAT